MLDLLKDVVWSATNAKRPVRIRAGGTKDWYGETPTAEVARGAGGGCGLDLAHADRAERSTRPECA